MHVGTLGLVRAGEEGGTASFMFHGTKVGTVATEPGTTELGRGWQLGPRFGRGDRVRGNVGALLTG